jgi:hypothetical protein
LISTSRPDSSRRVDSRPRRGVNWPEGAIDRDASIAISDFAPGNEVVREKLVYTVVGLAAFGPRGNIPVPIAPLGPVTPVGICDICKMITPDPPHSGRKGGSIRHRRCHPLPVRATWPLRSKSSIRACSGIPTAASSLSSGKRFWSS